MKRRKVLYSGQRVFWLKTPLSVVNEKKKQREMVIFEKSPTLSSYTPLQCYITIFLRSNSFAFSPLTKLMMAFCAKTPCVLWLNNHLAPIVVYARGMDRNNVCWSFAKLSLLVKEIYENILGSRIYFGVPNFTAPNYLSNPKTRGNNERRWVQISLWLLRVALRGAQIRRWWHPFPFQEHNWCVVVLNRTRAPRSGNLQGRPLRTLLQQLFLSNISRTFDDHYYF